MDAGSLECLPDELLLDVVEHLDTARDVAHLEASCRRARTLIQHEGWRTFVRHRFRTLDLPSDQKSAWGTLARRLTYQHECWEKRGFQVFEFQEQASRNRRAQANVSGRSRQSVAFYPVMDARALRSTHDELAVWGLGEDLITKVKTATHGSDDPQWYVAKGHDNGYSAGFGDVTAVSIVDRHGAPQVAIGRANGDVQLAYATGDKVGSVVQTLSAPTSLGAASNGDSGKRKSPGQSAVSWLEWQPTSNIVAGSTNSTVALYNLDSGDEKTLPPNAHYDVSQDSLDGDISLVRSVKFMGNDTIACALGGSRHPLRWAKVTPTGLVFSKAAENPGLVDYMSTKSDITVGEKTTVRAIETVEHGTNDSLLLSAWDDGTYRYVWLHPRLNLARLTRKKTHRHSDSIAIRCYVSRPLGPLRSRQLARGLRHR
jgi:hypothetical protein